MPIRRAASIAIVYVNVLLGQTGQDWTHYVRIAGNGLRSDNADQIVRSATETNVFGIEVDNDIPGRFES